MNCEKTLERRERMIRFLHMQNALRNLKEQVMKDTEDEYEEMLNGPHNDIERGD